MQKSGFLYGQKIQKVFLTGFRITHKETSRVYLRNCILQRRGPTGQGQRQGGNISSI